MPVKPKPMKYHLLPPDAPSPLDFDYFIPWLCRQLRLPEVIEIQRASIIEIDDDVSKSKSMSKLIISEPEPKMTRTKSRLIQSHFHAGDSSFAADSQYPTIVLRTVYDSSDDLIELMIKNNDKVEIPAQLMKCIGLCLVFYPFLRRISFIKCRLNKEFVYEVGNVISDPASSISELWLDNSFVPFLNYYSLVANNCFNLITISLNNCRINDLALEYLLENIETNAPNLRSLELARNYITDKGTDIIAKTLRTNRGLLHLNLAGNRITDVGAIRVMDCCAEFKLTPEEVLNLRKKRMAYFRKQAEEHAKSVEGERLRTKLTAMSKDSAAKNDVGAKDSGAKDSVAKDSVAKDSSAKDSSARDSGAKEKKKSSPKPRRHVKGKKAGSNLKMDTHKVKSAGSLPRFKPFKDLYDEEHTYFDKGEYYCTGNLKLCWLNLSYNYLEYGSIKRAYDILLYQNFISKPPDSTGLLRFSIDGIEMHTDTAFIKAAGIKKLLQKAVLALIPLESRSVEGGIFHKKRRLKKTKLFS